MAGLTKLGVIWLQDLYNISIVFKPSAAAPQVYKGYNKEDFSIAVFTASPLPPAPPVPPAPPAPCAPSLHPATTATPFPQLKCEVTCVRRIAACGHDGDNDDDDDDDEDDDDDDDDDSFDDDQDDDDDDNWDDDDGEDDDDDNNVDHDDNEYDDGNVGSILITPKFKGSIAPY